MLRTAIFVLVSLAISPTKPILAYEIACLSEAETYYHDISGILRCCERVGVMDLGDAEAQPLIAALTWFDNLQSLVIEDSSLRSIPGTIMNLGNLVALYIRNNPHLCEIPQTLIELKYLKILALTENQALATLPTNFSGFKLDVLDLRYNHDDLDLPKPANVSEFYLRVD